MEFVLQWLLLKLIWALQGSYLTYVFVRLKVFTHFYSNVVILIYKMHIQKLNKLYHYVNSLKSLCLIPLMFELILFFVFPFHDSGQDYIWGKNKNLYQCLGRWTKVLFRKKTQLRSAQHQFRMPLRQSKVAVESRFLFYFIFLMSIKVLVYYFAVNGFYISMV